MKKLTIMTAAALMVLPALADNHEAAAKTESAKAEAAKCCPKADKMPQQCWLNIDTITLEAANGDPLAQYTIAYLTDQGVNIPKDSEKAKELYSKAAPGLRDAAAKGHPAACFALAHMYAEGKGVEKNADKAAEYHKWGKQCCTDKKKNCCTADEQMNKAEEAATVNPAIDQN